MRDLITPHYLSLRLRRFYLLCFLAYGSRFRGIRLWLCLYFFCTLLIFDLLLSDIPLFLFIIFVICNVCIDLSVWIKFLRSSCVLCYSVARLCRFFLDFTVLLVYSFGHTVILSLCLSLCSIFIFIFISIFVIGLILSFGSCPIFIIFVNFLIIVTLF